MTRSSKKKPKVRPEKNAIGITSFFLKVTTGFLSSSFFAAALSPFVKNYLKN